MDAPKRIWLDWPAANKGDPVFDEPPENDTQAGQTEYLRADLHRAALESMQKKLQAAEAQTAKAVERALTAEAVIREDAATIKRLRGALDEIIAMVGCIDGRDALDRELVRNTRGIIAALTQGETP